MKRFKGLWIRKHSILGVCMVLLLVMCTACGSGSGVNDAVEASEDATENTEQVVESSTKDENESPGGNADAAENADGGSGGAVDGVEDPDETSGGNADATEEATNEKESGDESTDMTTETAITEGTEIGAKEAAVQAEPEASAKKGPTTLTYIGHASVKIVAADGTVIYIDPNYEGDYSDEADYVLVTHAHSDHQPREEVVLKEGGKLITYVESHPDGKYETYDFGNVMIEAVAAGGNPNHSIECCVGYLVTVDGLTFYHAGDTSMIDQMKELSSRVIDYALYPIDGIYNMDAVEAAQVANLVGAKNNIPIHEFDKGDVKKSDNFLPEGRLVLAYGETMVVKE